MILVASSKHKSMRLARIWKRRSPGDDTAWREPARTSRKGCSSAGRGSPNRRSHASEPIPITQLRPASRSRNSTARISAESSAQNERTAARLSGPGFMVTTRKIAARVSGADTGCETMPPWMPAFAAVIGELSLSGIWRELGSIHIASPTSGWQRAPDARRAAAEVATSSSLCFDGKGAVLAAPSCLSQPAWSQAWCG